MVSSANQLNSKLLAGWSICVLILLYLPIASLFVYGFNAGAFALRWEGFSLRWYAEAFANEALLTALLNSLAVAIISSLMAVLLGFLYAFWAHRIAGRRLASASDSLISLPLFIPEIVIAIGLLVMTVRVFRPTALQLGVPISSLTAVVLGHTTLALGYAALILRTRFKNYDLQQELAARDLGAGRWDIFQHVLLPQIAPALVAAACISFAVSLDDFYVSYFLSTGGSSLQTLPLYIWSLQGRRAMTPEINVVSSILLFIALGFFTMGLFLNRKTN